MTCVALVLDLLLMKKIFNGTKQYSFHLIINFSNETIVFMDIKFYVNLGGNYIMNLKTMLIKFFSINVVFFYWYIFLIWIIYYVLFIFKSLPSWVFIWFILYTIFVITINVFIWIMIFIIWKQLYKLQTKHSFRFSFTSQKKFSF